MSNVHNLCVGSGDGVLNNSLSSFSNINYSQLKIFLVVCSCVVISLLLILLCLLIYVYIKKLDYFNFYLGLILSYIIGIFGFFGLFNQKDTNDRKQFYVGWIVGYIIRLILIIYMVLFYFLYVIGI